jgi:hypothetical protein
MDPSTLSLSYLGQRLLAQAPLSEETLGQHKMPTSAAERLAPPLLSELAPQRKWEGPLVRPLQLWYPLLMLLPLEQGWGGRHPPVWPARRSRPSQTGGPAAGRWAAAAPPGERDAGSEVPESSGNLRNTSKQRKSLRFQNMLLTVHSLQMSRLETTFVITCQTCIEIIRCQLSGIREEASFDCPEKATP